MASATTGGYTRPEMLAETGWLEKNLDDPNLRIIDCRDDPEGYYEGHVPRAVYMDHEDTNDDTGLYVLPPEEAARTFGELGSGTATRSLSTTSSVLMPVGSGGRCFTTATRKFAS